jgi:hypothetical protein
MSNNYVIQWKSRVNGRAGKGSKLFSREEADKLAEELNQEYPEIEHAVLSAEGQQGPLEQPANEKQEETVTTGPTEPVSGTTQVLSLQE